MLLIGVIYWNKSSIFQRAVFGHIAFFQLGSDRLKKNYMIWQLYGIIVKKRQVTWVESHQIKQLLRQKSAKTVPVGNGGQQSHQFTELH